MNPGRLEVSVVYARADRQWVVKVALQAPATLQDAFERSGLRDLCPEFAGQLPELGIFHRRRDPDTLLRDGDRVEVYRPLLLDPMEARRLRARRAQKKTQT